MTQTLQASTTVKNPDMLSPEDVQFVLDLVIEAGKLAVTMRQGVEITTKTSADDLLTSADKALSELIIKRLSERFPQDLVLSEEAPWQKDDGQKRRWIIDPIDGTKYYVDGTGKYAVMVGLVSNGREQYGWIYMPFYDIAYAGGPGALTTIVDKGQLTTTAATTAAIVGPKLRLLVSRNDLNANAWLKELPDVELVTASSIAVDVHELKLDIADIFVHIRPTLGYWDTAATGAVAQSMGFEVGTEVDDFISYGHDTPVHKPHIIIGKRGALSRWRKIYTDYQQLNSADSKQ